MSIEIINLGVIEQKVKQRIGSMEKAFQKAVQSEKEVISTRTQEGLDVNRETFVPYSSKNPGRDWKDVRKKKNLQTSHVDLKFSGAMFKAMTVSFKRDGSKFLATIFFNERKQSQKAKGHNSGQLGPTTFAPRKFFGLSQTQREAIISKIRDAK